VIGVSQGSTKGAKGASRANSSAPGCNGMSGSGTNGVGAIGRAVLPGSGTPASGIPISHAESAVPGLHDFDFLVGHWQVHRRKLKHRLVNSHEWIEFEGTLFNQPLMGGYRTSNECHSFCTRAVGVRRGELAQRSSAGEEARQRSRSPVGTAQKPASAG
jgi:hypothetical protein